MFQFANICFVIVTISHQTQVKWGGCAIISSLPMEEVNVCLFSNFPPATYHLAPPAAGGDWKQEEPKQPRQGGGFARQENVSSKICHGEDSGEDRWRFRWRMLLLCINTNTKVGEERVLAVTCIHLDHKLEPRWRTGSGVKRYRYDTSSCRK